MTNELPPLRLVTGYRELPWRYSRPNLIARFVELRLECGHTLDRCMGVKLVQLARCEECQR